MKIEAVIICKDYSDFLKESLTENLHHLDRVVVVTHPNDWDTRNLCNRLGIDCLDTTVFHDDGDKFNKGRAINLGLSHLRHDDWLLHLDADTVLPPRFRDMMARAKLDEKFIYGCDRLNVVGYDNWMKLKAERPAQFSWRYLVTPPSGHHLGARLLHMEYGYCPIGYFQLWHKSANRRYPVMGGSAEHSDVLFAVQWPREKRILLPEMFVYHLESEPAKMGANWGGRTTKPFKAEPKQKEPEHKHECECKKHRHHPPPWMDCKHKHHCKWAECHCCPKPCPYHPS